MIHPTGCREPAVRAATLVHTPGALSFATLRVPQPTSSLVACVWFGTALALVAPGPLADSLGPNPEPCAAAAVATSCSPCGARHEHARLNLYGTLRTVLAPARKHAALHLFEMYPCEELLDATDDGGGRLVTLEITGSDWTVPCGTLPQDLPQLFSAPLDEVLRWSPVLCGQLNAAHPEIAARLAGVPGAWLAELDRDGATVGLPGPQPDYLRADWPYPCHSLHDLHHALAHCGSHNDHGRLPKARPATPHAAPLDPG